MLCSLSEFYIYEYILTCICRYIYMYANKILSRQCIVFKNTEGYCKKNQNGLFVSVVDGM